MSTIRKTLRKTHSDPRLIGPGQPGPEIPSSGDQDSSLSQSNTKAQYICFGARKIHLVFRCNHLSNLSDSVLSVCQFPNTSTHGIEHSDLTLHRMNQHGLIFYLPADHIGSLLENTT